MKYRFNNSLRKRIFGMLCVYCGEIAIDDEHFPPANFTPYGLILPSCKECNSLAGTEWAFDFTQRHQSVKSKLRRRYKKILSIPMWNESDLKLLAPYLKKEIKECLNRKKIIQRRLAWNVEDYLLNIDHNNYFAEFNAKIDTIINPDKRLLPSGRIRIVL